MRRVLILTVLGATAFLGAGCSKPLSEDECDRLLDHYTEHLLRSEHRQVTPEVIVAKQAEARDLARSDPHFEFYSCADEVSREQFECAILAPSIDAIERCLVL